MKFSKISIYTLLLAGLGISSCNREEYSDPESGLDSSVGEVSNVTFKASMGKSLSKSTVSRETGATTFEETDNLKVFPLQGDGVEFNFAGGNDDYTEAYFQGFIGSSNGYFAMLPYQENASLSGDVISMNLPTEQKDIYEELMVSYSSGNDMAFQFKHVGAMVKFTTHKKYKKITIEATDGTKIAGDIQVKVSKTGGAPVVTGGTSSVVSIEREIETTDAVLITLKPGKIAAGQLKITFTKTDGSSFSHIIANEMNFESGVMYTYGNVGQYKVTCWKDYTKTEKVFELYAADYDNKHQLYLPTLPAPEGKMYGFSTVPNATSPQYTTIMNIDDNTEIYPILCEGKTVTVYNNGNDAVPTVITGFANEQVKLPTIGLTAEEGYCYGYTSIKDDVIQFKSGDMMQLQSDIKLYLVKKKLFTFNIYVNGANEEPITETAIPTASGIIFTLPELPIYNGKFGGYSKLPNDQYFTYYEGATFTYDNLDGSPVTNFYAVYRDKVATSAPEAYTGFAGKTVGYTSMSGSAVSESVKVEKGKCLQFTFTNHCGTSTSSSQRVNNVGIILSADGNTNSQLKKEMRLDLSNYGQVMRTPENVTSSFLKNTNDAVITVQIYNNGGVADVVCSWTGTSDKKQYNVHYNNICTWDNLYVTFSVKNSYIEF